jgi:ParB family chromosome partitioning protein
MPPATESAEGLQLVELAAIRANQKQPREKIAEQGLQELARSIERQGVLQPIILRQSPEGGYDLIAGERRWRAAKLAGLDRIPAVIKDVSDDAVLEIALIENIQREELNPIEEANAYHTLVDRLGLTQQELAERVGKPRATVANALRLLHLPAAVQELIKQGAISAGHAKALAALADTRAQSDLASRIASEGLSVRETEELVARSGARKRRAPAKPVARDPNVVAAEEELQRALGTKVRIVQGKKGGRLELHFFSDEELDRVYQLVLEAAGK